MTLSILLVLGLLVGALVLFATEALSVDIVTLLVLLVLVACRILPPAEAFAGFANEIIFMLAALFVLSAALQETGVMDRLGAALFRASGKRPLPLLLALMGTVAGASAVMNNTTTTAVFVPPTLGLARQIRVSPSKLLLPLAFASILGGTLTLIGTSTNVAVSGFIQHSGMKPLGLFEATPVGLAIVAVGIAYMALVGRHLLPDHPPEDPAEEFGIREYLSEIVVLRGSKLIGQRVFQSQLAEMGFRVLEVIRHARRFVPVTSTTLEEGDLLLVQGLAANLMKVRTTAGIEIMPELKHGDLDVPADDVRIAELLISPQSEVDGLTLAEANFRQRYDLVVLAIYRAGQPLRDKLRSIRLRMGDLMLVQGRSERIAALRRGSGFFVLGEVAPRLYPGRKGLYVMSLFGIALALGATGVLPVAIALLAAAVGTVLLRCLSMEEAYNAIDWRLLVLIGGMTAFGSAMERTGAAAYLAHAMVATLAPLGEMAVLAGFAVLTVLLTQPMSNAAAALVVLPVAISAAQGMGLNPRTFAIGIMLSASVSFIAPLEPSCILVYNPGRYRFVDFVKVGSLLTIVLLAVVLLMLPVFWPLHPVLGHAPAP